MNVNLGKSGLVKLFILTQVIETGVKCITSKMSNEKLFSIQTGKITHFTEVDYVLFGLLLVISAGIGLFFAIKDRRHNDTKTFLMAGGDMSPFPVALSLLASFMSAITILGTPAEMYNYTTMYYWIGLSYLFVAFGAAHVFMPIFYRLRVRSAYEGLRIPKSWIQGLFVLCLTFSFPTCQKRSENL